MKIKINLSQCMIVKNEEKNIRKALNWGKNIVCEQIVVDTGSTDRTVEIAEEMGAKVFHFEWIDDFSAAKNFAIEQATGNWIAFLDADEYFSEEDTKKILPLLAQLEEERRKLKIPLMVRSSLANLDDEGRTSSIATQARLFSNVKSLRYDGRIHETLMIGGTKAPKAFEARDILTVYHTGYTDKVYKETKKMERNISILKKEVEKNKDNYEAWAYLGDSFLANKQMKEAEEAYNYVVENMSFEMFQERRDFVFCNLLKINYYRNKKDESVILDIYHKSVEFACLAPDAEYWVALWMLDWGKLQQGIEYMELALRRLEVYDRDGNLDMAGSLPNVYGRLFEACKSLNRAQEAVRYGTLYLRMEPYGESVLIEMIRLFKGGANGEEIATAILSFLSKLYDLSRSKDKLFLIRISRKLMFDELEKGVLNLLTQDEKEFLHENQSTILGM
uniref:tetratricopeptide repeat-containing glycosyltransferase family 2 protein n=1 Tax=Clostridium sp. 12(A) TaxID=1163671 RepID=UPI00046386C5|nr:glycosyltransferase family 2 protein [Clostridium sp. 12(A)]